MKTLALLAQKGGTGKTTLAVHLSVISALEGKNTILVDLDPQRSAADWWEERTAAVPALVKAEAGDLTDLVTAAKSEKVDTVIVDTAPHAREASAMAAKVADLVADTDAAGDPRPAGDRSIRGDRAEDEGQGRHCPEQLPTRPPRGRGGGNHP